MNPFDDLAVTLTDRYELINHFRSKGFTYMSYDSPDPGHPCSRPYSELSW